MALTVVAIDEVGHADDAISYHSCNNGAPQGHHAPSLIVWQNETKNIILHKYLTIIFRWYTTFALYIST